MAVDSGYGSGKPRSAANSRSRRRVAAGKLTKSKPKKKYDIEAGRARMAASPLGQAADVAMSFLLPGGAIKGISRMFSPQSVRIAGAAGRAISRAASGLTAAEAKIAAGKEMQTAGTAIRNSVRYSTPGQNTTRLGLDFANPVGNKPNQAYNYVIKDVARKGIPEGTKSAYEIGTAGRLMQESGRTAVYNASKAAQRAGRTVEGGKYAASEEIKRRLKALRGGGR